MLTGLSPSALITECIGNTRRTSSLISSLDKARKALGRVPATSPRPPTFTKGSASAARNKTLMVWDIYQLYNENQEALKSVFVINLIHTNFVTFSSSLNSIRVVKSSSNPIYYPKERNPYESLKSNVSSGESWSVRHAGARACAGSSCSALYRVLLGMAYGRQSQGPRGRRSQCSHGKSIPYSARFSSTSRSKWVHSTSPLWFWAIA